jgi:hypothetical protein
MANGNAGQLAGYSSLVTGNKRDNRRLGLRLKKISARLVVEGRVQYFLQDRVSRN